MDIVDIDKVLDDLELNEDQHIRTIKNELNDTSVAVTVATTSSVNSAHHERQSSSSSKCQRNERDVLRLRANGQQPTVPSSYATRSPPQGGQSNEIPTQQPPPLNRMTKTNYVNVSNVFLSLNEYMNAGVEAVKIAKESSEALDSSSVAVASISENEFSNTMNGSEVIPSMPTNEEVTLSQIQQGIESTSTSTSTSTTSSPPSSPGIVDTETNTIDQPNTSAANDCQSLDDSDSAVSHASDTGSSLSILPPTSLISSINNSSIVQPTSIASPTNTMPAMPSDEEDECPENVDSRNALNNYHQTNENHVDTNQLDCERAGEIATSEAVVPHENVEQTPAQNIVQPAATLGVVATEPDIKLDDRFIKPLCFEAAATMDDVSDAELESYLQELEDLEASPDVIRCENVSTATISSFDADNRDTGSTNECGVDELESSKMLANSEMTSKMLESTDINADSFSQASTVEFADINADSDAQLNFVISKNEKDSDFDDHKTASEPDTSRDIDREDTEECEMTEPIDESKNKFEEAVAASEVEAQFVSAAPKRPNTLELPSSFNETGRKMEVGTTPGNDLPTPEIQANDAASAATSCSSSEESNVVLTDTSIRSEDATHSQCDSDADIDAAVAASNPNDTIAPELASSATSNVATMPSDSAANISINNLGKVQPYWIPDNMTMCCMQCNQKFSFIKRRHHCRACGQVLCSTCCSLKAKLEYMGDVEARICVQCDILLNNRDSEQDYAASGIDVASAIDANAMFGSNAGLATRSPNPNNPMEYCSVIPPHQQVASASTATPISVMVPVGVLKREGAPPKTARKEVMFSDGIRPGCDLTELDNNWTPTRSNSSDGNGNVRKSTNRRVQTPPGS